MSSTANKNDPVLPTVSNKDSSVKFGRRANEVWRNEVASGISEANDPIAGRRAAPSNKNPNPNVKRASVDPVVKNTSRSV